MKKTNIILCGFMGSGKTIVGKTLAKEAQMDFIDLDAFIEADEKKSISDIFAESGEAYFRTLEKKAVMTLCKRENTVIATGGGTVLDSENVGNLKKTGTVILLTSSLEKLKKRLLNNTARPLLQKENKEAEICALFEKRFPLYKAAADYEINSEGNVNDIAKEIMRIVNIAEE